MKLKLRLIGVVGMSVVLTLSAMTSGHADPDISSADFPTPTPVSSSDPEVTTGKVESISPSEVLGEEQARSLSAATKCNQQDVVLNYPELRFTGVKKWCFDGKRVTQGTMEVKPFVKPEFRYTQNRDGWVYVPKALKKTDQFVTVKGVARGAHKSVRTGRFEYRVNGQTKPQTVYIPSVTRIGYGTGACNGPKSVDLAPRITAVAPSPGETGFTRKGNIVAKLNMEAKEGTSNLGTFYAVNNKTGEYVEGATGRYTPDLSMIIIVPYKPLAANTKYTATVAAGPYGVLGKTGDPLMGGKTWTFTTGAK